LFIGNLEAGTDCQPPPALTSTLFVNVKNDMAIAEEEIFGPMLHVIAYDSEDEAVGIANDSK
jgi:aldehyde dehydrogenase (NAD+)